MTSFYAAQYGGLTPALAIIDCGLIHSAIYNCCHTSRYSAMRLLNSDHALQVKFLNSPLFDCCLWFRICMGAVLCIFLTGVHSAILLQNMRFYRLESFGLRGSRRQMVWWCGDFYSYFELGGWFLWRTGCLVASMTTIALALIGLCSTVLYRVHRLYRWCIYELGSLRRFAEICRSRVRIRMCF